MATKKKMLEAAAGTAAAGGASLDITDVFSTYLYDGTSGSLSVNNGIDLDGEGGMVWHKGRDIAESHNLFDTERGDGYILRSESTQASDGPFFGQSFTSTGFSLNTSDNQINSSSNDYVSWTWRKAPKFFDVQTWTGDSTSNRAIPHNLGGAVGSYFVKCTSDSTSSAWVVWHKDLSSNARNLVLNTTAGESSTDYALFSTTAPNSSNVYLGTDYKDYYNATGRTYVAYLFAHNDSGDGEFGPDGDQDIIKCGSYTSSNPSNRPEVDLGFEPQWLLIKNATASSNWMLVDNMRGLPVNLPDQTLAADSSAAENGVIGSPNAVALTPTGFNLTAGSTAANAGTGNTHIYMAIRRGPLAPPEAGTEVFKPLTYTSSGSAGNKQTTGFPVDLAIIAGRTDTASWKHAVIPRLTGGLQYLSTSSTAAETGTGSGLNLDDMTGYTFDGAPFNNSGSMYSLNWKRAPGYFDCVAYSGTGANRTVSHNVLGVAPEMMWIKGRNYVENWAVYHKDVGATKYLMLNQTSAEATYTAAWNNTAPTSSVFTLGGWNAVNENGYNYIAYLFASLAGVSKVGSYTGNGSSQTINAGFTAGARFILIKRTDSTGDWYVWDSVRGVVTGNSPHLSLNTTAAEVTSDDSIDPDSSGFIVNQVAATNINVSSASYIYYAVA